MFRFRIALALPLALTLAGCLAIGSPSAMAQAATPAAGTDGAAPMSDAAFAAKNADLDAQQRALTERTTENDYRYAVAQHDCYAKFLVNHCIETARATMRTEKGSIRQAQLALSAERRDTRKEKRVADDATKQAQTAAAAPAKAANEARNRAAFDARQQQHQVDLAKRGDDSAQRAANAAAYARKQSAHQQALDQARRDAAADAAKRADNVQRYEAKQQAAAQRQVALEERQRQAKARADASAAASAAQAASAAATAHAGSSQ